MKAFRSTAVIAIPLAVATWFVSGCSATKSDGPAAETPSGLEAFYSQPVDWVPCGVAETAGWFPGETLPGQVCGQVVAPLDYQTARGHAVTDTETVQLAVTRRPAAGVKKGTLLAISGGPGLPGLAMVDMAFPESVLSHFDIVAYDPRGVGKSTPAISCPHLHAPAAAAAENRVDVEERKNRELVASCVAGTGLDVLRHIGSDEATNDVDLLRGVLGEPRINLWAASYGTQIAAMYAIRFPHGYRAAVLDGVVDISERQNDMLAAQKRGYQETFDRIVAYCTGAYEAVEHARCPLGSDPGSAQSTFQQLLRDADASPVPAATGKPVTASDILSATAKGLLWQSRWVPYLRALDAVRHGDGTAIRRMADNGHTVEDPDQSGTSVPQQPADAPATKASTEPYAITAITCADTARPTSDRAVRQQDAQALIEAAPFENYQPLPAEFPLDVCDLWPFPGVVQPAAPSRADDAAPLLFVATRHDPTTPIGNAERMAKYLDSPLVIREGDGHTFVFADQNRCIDTEVARYLEDPNAVRDKVCQ
ncbi:alpha/beta fold hydrolase [Nocardia uniformis]|uniref:Alpha/beta fold hydrolase n=1 Tax=Nocardia uniformis TaxID=53432 RepID=A0A849C235_9NOCA|nr:alpha/beta hydrolase [Nocardia uniformis]NNH70490.1 alpha/beta fold hydrolase [Nocardia uniformis]